MQSNVQKFKDLLLWKKKHIFSALYIYKLVLPEPANSQNEENKRVLHGLCSPPTGKSALLLVVQIQLAMLCNKRKDVPLQDDRRYQRGGCSSRGEDRCVQWKDSSVSQCRCSELDTQIALLLVVEINISAYFLSQLQNNRRDGGCVSFLTTTGQPHFLLVSMCVLTTLR